MKSLTELFLMLLWIAGIVLAQGFWQVFFAILFPPYSWYKFAEWAIMRLS